MDIVTVSEQARVKAIALREAEGRPADAVLRVGVQGGGCSGFQYLLEYDERRDDDHVLELTGLTIVIDPVLGAAARRHGPGVRRRPGRQGLRVPQPAGRGRLRLRPLLPGQPGSARGAGLGAVARRAPRSGRGFSGDGRRRSSRWRGAAVAGRSELRAERVVRVTRRAARSARAADDAQVAPVRVPPRLGRRVDPVRARSRTERAIPLGARGFGRGRARSRGGDGAEWRRSRRALGSATSRPVPRLARPRRSGRAGGRRRYVLVATRRSPIRRKAAGCVRID